jgi:hypothetical protein
MDGCNLLIHTLMMGAIPNPKAIRDRQRSTRNLFVDALEKIRESPSRPHCGHLRSSSLPSRILT